MWHAVPLPGVKHPKFIQERRLELFVFGNNSQHLLSNINKVLVVKLLHVRAGEQVQHRFDTRCRQYMQPLTQQARKVKAACPHEK